MSKEMYISSSPHETKVAVLEDDQLVEVYFERDTDVGLVGGIYKGRVSRVLPGMQSAFVDIGLERDAFLYVSDFFYEDQEEYDKVFEEAEARATKFTAQQADAAAAAAAPAAPAVTEAPPAPAPLAEALATPAAEAEAPAVAPLEAEPQAATPTAPGSAAPASPSTPSSPRESYDRRPFDRDSRDRGRGRRRRHRGRPDFREGRRDDRRDDRRYSPPVARQEDETPSGPHTFEILPGESLAKYRSAAPSAGEAGESELSAVSPDLEQAGTPEAALEGADSDNVSEVGAPTEAVEAGIPHDKMPDGEPGLMPQTAAELPSLPSPTTEIETEVSAENSAAPEPPAASATVTEPTVALASSSVEAVAPVPPASATDPEPPAAAVAPSPAPEAAAPPAEAVEAPAPVAEETARPVAAESAPPVTEVPPSEAGAAATEPFSEPAEAGLLEEVEGDDELEEFEAGEEEFIAESELAAEGEIPAEAVAAVEGEAQSAAQSGAPAEAAAGESGDRSYTLREPHQRPRFAPRRRRGRRGPGGDRDRGPRRFDKPRDSARPGGNHHPVQISEVLKEGQEILVQIAKEPLGTKGARITSHVALPGRYLVFMPTIDHIGVSRKIASEEERLRLRNIILENKGSLTGGFIVRTAGQGRSEEEFKADLKFLSTLWNEIKAKSDRLKAPALIHRDLDLVQRLLRDLLTPDFKCVRVDSEIDYERVLDFVNRCQPALIGKVKLYSRDTPLYEEFGIQQEIEKALKPKVWLKSGGYIVINQTEALVAIDVNTGKYVGKTNRLEDTILKTNVDAVNEIVRQVRLRDLGGIIVIDFIDMDERKNRAKVVQALEEALRSDRAPTKVISFHDFGLVAVTRKRVKQSLERTLCVPCNYCTGSGWVKSVNTVCNEILAEAKKMAKGIDGNVITLRVNPEVAKALKSREGGLVSELESLVKKDVIIKSDPMVHQERFEIF